MTFIASVAALPQQLLVGTVYFYRWMLKPWLGNRCRFEPSCSAYALESLQRHGAARGSLLAGGRLLRCHPWCDGGIDPVPDRFASSAAGLFSRLGLPQNDAHSKTRNPP